MVCVCSLFARTRALAPARARHVSQCLALPQGKKKGKKSVWADKKKTVSFMLEPSDFEAMRPSGARAAAAQSGDADDEQEYSRAQWELAELGLPDDGYDYTQHLRTLGDGTYTSQLPREAQLAFVPENAVLYSGGARRMAPPKPDSAAARAAEAAHVHMRDVAMLPRAVQTALTAVPVEGAAGVSVLDDSVLLVTDADTDELDDELFAVMQRVEAGDTADICDLGDDFMLLANDGFIGGATLTTENLTAAQRAAREDFMREMMEEGDDDDDDEEGSYDDEEAYVDSDADQDDKDQRRPLRRRSAEPKFGGIDDRMSVGTIGMNGGTSYWARRTRSEYYAQSIADSGMYERSEAGKTMRSEALQNLDQHFDVFEQMYADDQIGDLEDEADDLGGDQDLSALEHIIEEQLRITADERDAGITLLTSKKNKPLVLDDLTPEEAAELKRTTLRLAEEQEARRAARAAAGKPADLELPRRERAELPEEKWDAESYTSLFSNTEHHPATIDAPRSGRRRRAPRRDDDADAPEAGASTEEIVRFRLTKSGIPTAGLLPKKKPPRRAQLAENDDDIDDDDDIDEDADGEEPLQAVHERPKDETKEEKARRKAAVKAAKADARARKKESRVQQRLKTRAQNRSKAHAGPNKALQL